MQDFRRTFSSIGETAQGLANKVGDTAFDAVTSATAAGGAVAGAAGAVVGVAGGAVVGAAGGAVAGAAAASGAASIATGVVGKAAAATVSSGLGVTSAAMESVSSIASTGANVTSGVSNVLGNFDLNTKAVSAATVSIGSILSGGFGEPSLQAAAKQLPGMVPEDISLQQGDFDVEYFVSQCQFNLPELTGSEVGTSNWNRSPTPGNQEEPLFVEKSPRPVETEAEKRDKAEQAQLQQIKAETMWNMVEEVPDGTGGKRKVLFLTNAQAALISGSRDRIKRLIEAFDIPTPQLFIHLLPSWGGHECIRLMKDFQSDPFSVENPFMCLNRDSIPWDSDEDAAASECRICRFLSEVVIKLAVETNAIILCGGLAGVCSLTRLLHRMVDLERAKWGSNVPFTIINYCNILAPLYKNPQEGMVWQQIRAGSLNWQTRDPLIRRLFEKDTVPPLFITDLQAGQYYIIVDSIDDTADNGDAKLNVDEPFQHLLTELTAYLQSQIPTINLKTGASIRELYYAKDSGGLGAALDAVTGNSPVLFLDSRMRPNLTESTRELIVQQAKLWWKTELNDVLMDRKTGQARGNKKATPNFMDVMALAYFRDVLFGDGNPVNEVTEVTQTRRPVPLHKMIKDSESESCMIAVASSNDMAPATKNEVREVVLWLARSFYGDCWELMDSAERAKHEEKGLDYETYYEAQLWTWVQHAESLLNSDKFDSINVVDIDGAKNLVRRLVRLDKLPMRNPVEGLRLLRLAWNEYDVGMHNAGRYKFLSKILFASQLIVQVAIVYCTMASVDDGSLGILRRLGLDEFSVPPLRVDEACDVLPQMLGLINVSVSAHVGAACPNFVHSIDGVSDTLEIHGRYLLQVGTLTIDTSNTKVSLQHLTFALTVVASSLISLWSYLKPVQRWRNLRSGVIVLESIIWQYRSRAGPFVPNPRNPSQCEQVLCELLTAWRNDFAGTDEQGSSLEKTYKPSVYKHFQYQNFPEPPKNPMRGREQIWTNDHQSPARPQAYLNMRLLPAMAFYQRRLPQYSWMRVFWTILTFIFTAASACFAYFQATLYVTLLSAVASSICSWIQFRDLSRKIDRYNCAVRNMKALIAWWDSLGEVEKASQVNISQLVLEGEAIITNENSTWSSSKTTTTTPKSENDK